MFKIESYVTPILLSYVDKYVRDFKPEDAQVSLWGGGVALHNLVLKADVLQSEVALPFTLVSGRIHELLIQVPWTKIMSEPIVVTIDTIECVLSLNPPTASPSEEGSSTDQPRKPMEAPPGYMQALVRRVVSNISVRVHHLIVKYVQDDIVLSLNVKHLAVTSADADWQPAFADIEQSQPVLRRLVQLDDLTLCLDAADADGKIRFFQEPLLYRCHLDLKVLTQLMSAATRRAKSISIQIRCSKLAWSITGDQLTMLLRLYRETSFTRPPTPAPGPANNQPQNLLSALPEPTRSNSWSDWAWSWMPQWSDRGAEEQPPAARALPLRLAFYLDDMYAAFKIMEVDKSSRRRARTVLEMAASHGALKCYICKPVLQKCRLGVRDVRLYSKGRCVCGQMDYRPKIDDPIVYLSRGEPAAEWRWPELAVEPALEHRTELEAGSAELTECSEPPLSDHGQPEEPPAERKSPDEEQFWRDMEPLLFIDYIHERSPPHPGINPYDGPPLDFQYSDWVEECVVKVALEPVSLLLCMGLFHRLRVIRNITREFLSAPKQEPAMRTLTVEEAEALSDNLPEKRVSLQARGMRVAVAPWEHAGERARPSRVCLELDVAHTSVVMNQPLYPHRVCSAAWQLPAEAGPLWRAARLHVTARARGAVVRLAAGGRRARPCARLEARLVLHVLLHQHYFSARESVLYGMSLNIPEADLCGSRARLQAACEILHSLASRRASALLRYTSLAADALNDDELVAIDLSSEELTARAFLTANTNTLIVTMQSAKATAFHEPKGQALRQAWIFSAPDAPISSPYLRLAIQLCNSQLPTSLDYVGIWTEPTGVCVDPLLIAWLAYKPVIMRTRECSILMERAPSYSLLKRRNLGKFEKEKEKATEKSSSGRGGSKSSIELTVHNRARSVSSSEKTNVEAKPSNQPQAQKLWWQGDRLLALHERLRHMLVNVEFGLCLLYVTLSPASALDCETVRDAMERHAAARHQVLAISLGRVSMYSSALTKHFWQEIKHDGPTFLAFDTDQGAPESFPWRVRLADVSCYTLEVSAAPPPRSQLRTPLAARPRSVLDPVTTTVTLSVLTKTLQIINVPKFEAAQKQPQADPEGQKTKYFTLGHDFKPTTLKEFVRGPLKKKKERKDRNERAPTAEKRTSEQQPSTSRGPVVSLGVHVHADTPPLAVQLDHDQVQLVAATAHCLQHIVSLVRGAVLHPDARRRSLAGLAAAPQEPARSGVLDDYPMFESISSEDVTETGSDRAASDMIPLFVADRPKATALKTFFYFQWVVSRVTVVGAQQHLKLALDVEDMIATADLQDHYNQLKVKIASANVRHFERRGSTEWVPGVLNGRVLEVRETVDSKMENHFLGVTVTQARISTLPANWKEELHPKLLEQKSTNDTMWEIFATLAPLEVVIEPKVMRQIVSLLREMSPRSFCPLAEEIDNVPANSWQWPFFYVSAGGARLLLTRHQPAAATDDTVMLEVGSVTVTPHPDNPICRRSTRSQTDSLWAGAAAGTEGRQYEVLVTNLSVNTTKFKELIELEALQRPHRSAENPALQWARPVPAPLSVTPLLHNIDVSGVLAPALWAGAALARGPAAELNLLSDCAVELGLDQLLLLRRTHADVRAALRDSEEDHKSLDENDRDRGVCPYAALIEKQETTLSEREAASDVAELGKCTDSGVGLEGGSSLKFSQFEELNPHLKKTTSRVAFAENATSPSEYLEVFVTMGVVRVSLYAADDGSPEVAELRAPLPQGTDPAETKDRAKSVDRASRSGSPAEGEGEDDAKLQATSTQTRRGDDHIPLLHFSLWQPNLYFWRKKAQRTLQFSLFDASVGLGAGDGARWSSPLLATARGTCDPLTDIPPALATIKLVAPARSGSNATAAAAGSLAVDVERPVELQLSVAGLRRLRRIRDLVRLRTSLPEDAPPPSPPPASAPHPLYRLRKLMLSQNIESVTVSTSQMSAVGAEGAAGWDSATLQVCAGGSARRLCARALLRAAALSAGARDARRLVAHPAAIGLEWEFAWESWRRAEGGPAHCAPGARLSLDADRLVLELRPADLAALARLRRALTTPEPDPDKSAESSGVEPAPETVERPPSNASLHEPAHDDHYYKDDLRSGAFKIVSGSMLPMAYQVSLHDDAVSWRYPHPRAITRLVAFPLPGQEVETPCLLEIYSVTLQQWEPHTHFTIPVGEPVETQICVTPPDAVFSVMWRYRVCESEEPHTRFVFDHKKFLPRPDPLERDVGPGTPPRRSTRGVEPALLARAVRVDSHLSPRLSPRACFALRLASVELHAHSAPPPATSQKTTLEGYYVSKPLMRSHRVLRLAVADLLIRNNFGSPAGHLSIVHAFLSSDILDSATGAMEAMLDEVRVQAGVSCPSDGPPRARVAASRLQVSLHVARLRTLQALARDWQSAYDACVPPSSSERPPEGAGLRCGEEAEEAALEGRVALWIRNTSSAALRVGQEGTDEAVPLGPGTSLAYRWCCPSSARKLRFSVAGPTDRRWSSSIPFAVGSYRVRLADAEAGAEAEAEAGAALHCRVEQHGAHRSLELGGRLCAANMLHTDLLYKVRSRGADNQWRTISSGELRAERIGNTVICAADADLVLKIKFPDKELGWTGDIPLKQCPKENVPWLVKVPSKGETPYTCVWCRVVRARRDARLLVAVWPLYVLCSLLPLDTDVMIQTSGGGASGSAAAPRQLAPGRGACTHLVAPGTTAARHTLSLQYSELHSPVTADPVPLHYGVTDTSVFDKRAPVATVEEVLADIGAWLERSGPGAAAAWPYSAVARHWPGRWRPSLLQPRSDVTVRYRAINAGGGCALEVRLCPAVLLCNAAPVPLTLRSHDAAPLCRLDPGTAVSPSSAVLQKPFFLSVELGRETYVSSSLAVTGAELGRYGAPARGLLALDHAAELLVLCDRKVALLSMFYEIKEDINVLGISSTYVLVNRMNTKILVSAIAVPKDTPEDIRLQPTTFKEVDPTPDNSSVGAPLCRFYLKGRWRGGTPDELRLYVTVSLPGAARASAPVRVARPPLRRALAVIDSIHHSVPMVVTQVHSEGRWVLSVSADPCPEFVVHNRTARAFLIAQPHGAPDEPGAGGISVRPECAGVVWHCSLSPGAVTHYSTPAHCERFPPPAAPAPPAAPLSFLTLAEHRADGTPPEWCAAAAAAEGEQLVALADVTVKLRVRTHPHSTLVELEDVDASDISASDIRNRLFEAFTTNENTDIRDRVPQKLERLNADNKLLTPEVKVGEPGAVSEDESFPALPHSIDPLRITDSIDMKNHPAHAEDEEDPDFSETAVSVIPSSERLVSSPILVHTQENLSQIETASLEKLEGHQEVDVASEKREREDLQRETNAGKSDAETPSAVLLKLMSPSSSKIREPVPKPVLSMGSPALESTAGSTASLGPGQPSDLAAAPWDRDPPRSLMSNVEDAQAPDEPKATSSQTSVGSNTESKMILFNGADADVASQRLLKASSFDSGMTAESIYREHITTEWDRSWTFRERLRLVGEGISLQLAGADDERPLVALHLDRAAVVLRSGPKRIESTISIANVQIDNLQYESGQFDFAVVAATRAEARDAARWPPLWNPFGLGDYFSSERRDARLLLQLTHDKWSVHSHHYTELTEVELRVGPLALYVEDAYVAALAQLARAAAPPDSAPYGEEAALRSPLRLRSLHVHPLEMTLTLHTAVRMYIALDQSPLTLGAFRLRDMMTSTDRLTQALTVHYLSAAILGAGWVVGGLELLGAPGALAARLGGARGGVRGVATCAAAALLRSLSAAAGSLARNLDLLAGDEEHSRRAQAARRRPPPNLLAGLAAGITNFAINILGAVGGLAHHPVVGVAVGEGSGGAALRRGLLGALAKPLSATADLVAFAGHGLLSQTGWDPAPQARRPLSVAQGSSGGWRRDCVRWAFRLAELDGIEGFSVLLDSVPMLLILTYKFLVLTDVDSERILEMIDFKNCIVHPYQGHVLEVSVLQKRPPKVVEPHADEEEDHELSAAARARVARYTGEAEAGAGAGGGGGGARLLRVLPAPGAAHSLHALLQALAHHNQPSHFSML